MSDLRLKDRQCLRVDNLMWKVTKLLTKRKKMILEEFNLTCSQFDILAAIYQITLNKQGVIQIDLAEKAQIDPMTTSTVLRNLQKRGLIARERGLINTRIVEVSMTNTGHELYVLAQKKIGHMQQMVYNHLDQQQLTSQLLLLTDKLNKLNYRRL